MTADVDDSLTDLLAERDPNEAAQGRTRLGGMFAHPYLNSYLLASSILVREGRASNTLDKVAVACVYLQRHLLELALKTLLGMMHDIAGNDVILAELKGRPAADLIPDAERKHLTGGHDLPTLLSDVRSALARRHAAGAEHSPLPDELAAIVDEFTKLERSELGEKADSSRLRYPDVKVPKERRREPKNKYEQESSFPKAVSVPIGHLQELIECLIDNLFRSVDSLGQELDIALRLQEQEYYMAGGS